MPGNDESQHAEAAVAEALSLFSTLTTAADVWNSINERRAGHDPTTQEGAHWVRPYLKEAARELTDVLVELHASLSTSCDQEHVDRRMRLVRRGSELMLIQRAARMLQPIHQRMLSLYPDIPEALVEEARQLQTTATRLLDTDADMHHPDASRFVRRAVSFCDALHRAL